MHRVAATRNLILLCLVDISMFYACVSDALIAIEEVRCNYAGVDTLGAVELSSTEGSLLCHKRFITNSGC